MFLVKEKRSIFLKLKKLLEPFGIKHYYTDIYCNNIINLSEVQHQITKKKSKNGTKTHQFKNKNLTITKKDYLLL